MLTEELGLNLEILGNPLKGIATVHADRFRLFTQRKMGVHVIFFYYISAK
jgi:hypothetical protein